MIALRPYQEQARAAVLRAFRAGHRSTLVVAATGVGKTRIAAGLLSLARRPALFFVHTRHLVGQTAASFRALGLTTGIEMAKERVGAELPAVTVACVPSLAKRLDSFPPDSFGLVIVDECHRILGSGHRAIVDHFASAKVCGLSATPDRGDGKPLGEVFESVAFEYDIRTAIRDSDVERAEGRPGWLCPLRMQTVWVEELSLANVAMKRRDYDPENLAKQLCVESALHAVASPLIELAGSRRTIVFCASVLHARLLADVMNRYRPESTIAVAGEDKDASDRIKRFTSGGVQFLCNVALLTEGFDDPEIACVALCRPSKSRGLICQQVGRGLRVHPGKADCLVLDFTCPDAPPDLRCPADVLGGLSTEVVAELRKRAAEPIDPFALLPEVEQYVADEIRRELIVRAEFRVLEAGALSPFSILGITVGQGRYAGAPPPPALIERLAELGLTKAELRDLDLGQAEAILDGMMNRRERGLCSLKVAKKLLRFGLNPDVSREDGGEAMAALNAEGWRACPPWLRADPRFRA